MAGKCNKKIYSTSLKKSDNNLHTIYYKIGSIKNGFLQKKTYCRYAPFCNQRVIGPPMTLPSNSHTRDPREIFIFGLPPDLHNYLHQLFAILSSPGPVYKVRIHLMRLLSVFLLKIGNISFVCVDVSRKQN